MDRDGVGGEEWEEERCGGDGGAEGECGGLGAVHGAARARLSGRRLLPPPSSPPLTRHRPLPPSQAPSPGPPLTPTVTLTRALTAASFPTSSPAFPTPDPQADPGAACRQPAAGRALRLERKATGQGPGCS
eukprot:205023-Rhodomonas_salina.1